MARQGLSFQSNFRHFWSPFQHHVRPNLLTPIPVGNWKLRKWNELESNPGRLRPLQSIHHGPLGNMASSFLQTKMIWLIFLIWGDLRRFLSFWRSEVDALDSIRLGRKFCCRFRSKVFFRDFPDDRLIRTKSWMNSTVSRQAEANACRTVALTHCRTVALWHCGTVALWHCRTVALSHWRLRPFCFLTRLGIEGHKQLDGRWAPLRGQNTRQNFRFKKRQFSWLSRAGNGG